MNAVKPEIVEPLLAVAGWKHDELVRVQVAIVRAGLRQRYVFPGDIAEDVVCEASRQGVASNAWNGLAALGIIARVPLSLTDVAAGIFGGRKRNGNESAKGRWTSVYTVSSRGLALAWLERHKCGLTEANEGNEEQLEMAVVS